MEEGAEITHRHEQPRSLTLFIVVVAMVIGVLAMHVFDSGMGNHNTPAMSSMAGGSGMNDDRSLVSVAIGPVLAGSVSAGPVIPGPVPAGPVIAMPASQPHPLMASMICILALILTGLLLVLAWPALLAMLLMLTSVARRRFPVTGSTLGRSPPDLHGLSIYRV